MKKKAVSFLEEYVNTLSPSGFEGEAAKIWKKEAGTFADEVKSDLHGNSFAVVNPDGKPRVMLAGHTDEIGLMISQITEDGYLFFNTIGGWDPQVLVGQRVRIRGKNGDLTGVVGRKPIHVLEEEEKKKVAKVEDLWIDIGVEDKEQAERLVEIGSPAVVDYRFRTLEGNLVSARGFDDKGGGFIVLEVARKLAGVDIKSSVHAVATVQEEVGLRGARTSSFGINPQIGIAVDVGFATDTPLMDKEKRKYGETFIGKGPIISRGPNINPKLFDLLLRTANEEDIPYQVVSEPGGTGTDANAIQLARSGVATCLVSIPNRYMHSPCELISLDDLDNIIKLITATVMNIKNADFEPF